MSRAENEIKEPRGRRRRPALPAAAAVLALVLAASLAGMALASGGATVKAGSSKLGRIGVDVQGRTLYALSPETTRHLLCKTSECLKFWPPLTVRSTSTKLSAGAGLHGHLGLLHRNGTLQVTLNGSPLYHYFGDHAKGQTNGQGIHSFGGTWHVLSAG